MNVYPERDFCFYTEKEVIEYYKGRGASEKTFDIQNNDFGRGHLAVISISKMHATSFVELTS